MKKTKNSVLTCLLLLATVQAIGQATYPKMEDLPVTTVFYPETQQTHTLCDRTKWLYFPSKKKLTVKEKAMLTMDATIGTKTMAEREQSRDIPCGKIIGELNYDANDKYFYEGQYFVMKVEGEPFMFVLQKDATPFFQRDKIADFIDLFWSKYDQTDQKAEVKKLTEQNKVLATAPAREGQKKAQVFVGDYKPAKNKVKFDDMNADIIYVEKGDELTKLNYEFKSKAFRDFYTQLIAMQKDFDKQNGDDKDYNLFSYNFEFYYADRIPRSVQEEKDKAEKRLCSYIVFEYWYIPKGGLYSGNPETKRFYLFEDKK